MLSGHDNERLEVGMPGLGMPARPPAVVGFLVHTRAVLREHYGPDPAGRAERVATILAAAVPLLAVHVKNGSLNIGLAEELCRLPPTAQREVLSQAGIKETRRFAT